MSKIDDFEKDHAHVLSKLKNVTAQSEVLEFQISHNALWAKGSGKTN
jgi:hypothetical protein